MKGPRGGNLPSLLCNITGINAKGARAGVDNIRVVFDSGAAASFLKESVAEELGLIAEDGGTRLLMGIAGKCTKAKLNLVELQLHSKVSSFFLPCVMRTLPVICAPLAPVDFAWEDIPEAPRDQVTETLPRVCAAEVHCLIGNDILPQLIDQVVNTGYEVRTLLWLSRLGVAIGGGTKSCQSFDETNVAVPEVSNEELYEQLRQFWSWQSLGVLPSRTVPLSPKEKFTVQHFKDNVKFVDGRYQIRLPFDDEKPLPVSNADLALSQFRSFIGDYATGVVRPPS